MPSAFNPSLFQTLLPSSWFLLLPLQTYSQHHLVKPHSLSFLPSTTVFAALLSEMHRRPRISSPRLSNHHSPPSNRLSVVSFPFFSSLHLFKHCCPSYLVQIQTSLFTLIVRPSSVFSRLSPLKSFTRAAGNSLVTSEENILHVNCSSKGLFKRS